MDTVEIRAATLNDVEAVEEYHHRCFTKTYSSQLLAGEFEAPDREGTRQQLLDWFRPESAVETRVAVVDGVPVGHFTICGHRLVHLFIEPDHQGSGLGRYLLARGEAMIVSDGHTDLELHARVENRAAIAFYERAGWTVTGRRVHTVEHGISYDEHILVKRYQGMGKATT
ncbi:MAG: GNAT family N-acetyltransferase [Actinomycetia bacterium]|nr:GNAT family N-acetyltransferase [Actinomycetes bacterium]